MKTGSSQVVSRQTEPHPRLVETVLKHAAHPWLRPIAPYARAAFEAIKSRVDSWSGPLILDTGCGTGMSTAILARRHPQGLVLGIDKSQARLERLAETLPANALIARMDLEDFWVLAHQAGWTFSFQYFFYPNPWPKPEHRLRRWAFHPVLPTALACGGIWELRTNWEVYAQEFSLAMEVLSGHRFSVESWNPAAPETLFEQKYLASGHPLWRWVSEPTTIPGS